MIKDFDTLMITSGPCPPSYLHPRVTAAQQPPIATLPRPWPGTRGAVLCHACVPPAEFGGTWPPGVPLQIHAMDDDPLFVSGGDLEAAREIVDATSGAEMYLYPGERHLFADSSLPAYERASAELLTRRVHAFVAEVA